ncbi:MAG: hypothetical protein ACOX8B_05640 [Lachnospiraceae bacterium]
MKKWISRFRPAALAAVLLAVCLSVSGCGSGTSGTAQAGSSARTDGSVDVSLFYGLQPELPADTRIPVEVTLSGYYVEEGCTVTLTVPTNAEDYYVYSQEWTGTADSETEDSSGAADETEAHLTFLVSAASGSGRIITRVYDREGNLAYSRTSSYQIGTETADDVLQTAAVLSDGQSTDSWSQYTVYEGRTVYLSVGIAQREKLPSDSRGYSSLTALIIDADSVAALTDAQKTALSEWQAGGGSILFLGTAAQAQEYGLAGLEAPYSWQISERAVLYEFDSETRPLWCMDRTQFYQTMEMGYSLELMSLVCDYSAESAAADAAEKLTAAEKALCDSQSGIRKSTDMVFLVILFAVYIAVLAAVSYILLRKKKRRTQYRFAAAGTAALFAAAVWISGNRTRITDPFERGTVILRITADGVREDSLFSLQGPVNTQMTFAVDAADDLSFSAVQTGNGWTDTNYARMDTCTMEIERSDTQLLIRFGESSTFSSHYFQMSRFYPFDQADASGSAKTAAAAETTDITAAAETADTTAAAETTDITAAAETADITAAAEDSGVPCLAETETAGGDRQFTNQTGYDLTDAVILEGDLLWQIGDLADGESVVLPESEASSADEIFASGIWPGTEDGWEWQSLYNAWLEQAVQRQTFNTDTGALLFGAAGTGCQLQASEQTMEESNLLFVEAEAVSDESADAADSSEETDG